MVGIVSWSNPMHHNVWPDPDFEDDGNAPAEFKRSNIKEPIMGFIAKAGGAGQYKLVPAGSHVARCFSIIDLGTQTANTKFGVKSEHRLLLQFEVFGEDEDGTPLVVERDGKQLPMTIRTQFKVSLHQKARLRAFLASWRGRDFTEAEAAAFDVSKLVGAYGLINVTHSANGERTYANISGISPLPKQLAANKPAGVHSPVIFNMDEPDMDVFASLPEWLQNAIRSAPEWAGKPTPAAATADDDTDDVPF